MRKIMKNIFLLLLVLILIYYFIGESLLFFNNFSQFTLPDILINFTELASLVFLIFNFVYKNINTIFEKVERLKMYLLNPTVDWDIQTIYHIDELDENFINKVFEKLSNEYDTFKMPDSYLENLSKYYIDIENNRYTLSIENMPISDLLEIRFMQNYRISYRESYKNLHYEYSKIEQDIRMVFSNTKSIKFLLTIKFDELNPFYKITLKTYNKLTKFTFNMKYTIEGCDVRVKNNEMTISSDCLKKVEDISKKYIALSNNSLFN
ncbi:hypothetical protein [Facklamia miroungae]|uniref:Uncharacterized protein n=1 Tax=Facklamia miroungae TaxID=120956 RepID=A0A1G7NXE1_9LACT|nr:hypothetical protein [Facklamia miroungae]NKZ28504.1 hypothetical protein [Facklamia miroungae]SDF78702.1 hypothetical protein SAMN05421791_10144 [Facklamia miroungae]